jgi:hypothetical protein
MKKITISATLIIMISVSLVSCEKETDVPANNLPQEIQDYISYHFSNNPILQATEDVENLIKNYEVILSDLTKLEFNRQKKITDIESPQKLPDSVVPDLILTWKSINFPENNIVEWELEDRHQEIKLDNNLEIDFNMAGDFLRIDN